MARASVGAIVEYLQKLTAPPGGDEADARLVRRFTAGRDEAAFAAIVRRHGPMVMGVCRRRLHDSHEAEDAFQAVFLVFMRKAGSLRRPARLANWLHGVARRVAARAWAGVVRRRAGQQPLGDAPAPAPEVSPEARELRGVLDEAIGRLPDKYRAPVVLCYLEGKTYAEAARALGWAEGTVSGRLARARDLLRRRLARSGAVVPAGLLALPSEAIRNERVKSLTEAVVRTAAGGGAAGAVSPRAIALAKGVLKEMVFSKVKLVLAGLFVFVLAGAGVVAVGYGRAPAPDGGRPAAPAVAQVTLKPSEVDDLASILHIRKTSGKVQFPGPVKKAQLVLKFYKAGRLVKTLDNAAPLVNVSGVARKADAVEFSLQAADLDYLPLGGSAARGEGAKNACRLQLNLQLLEAGSGAPLTGSGGSTDVPKDLFDFGQASGGSAFSAAADPATGEVPLCYLLANTDEFVGADTPAGVLAQNGKADVLIVSLWTPK